MRPCLVTSSKQYLAQRPEVQKPISSIWLPYMPGSCDPLAQNVGTIPWGPWTWGGSMNRLLLHRCICRYRYINTHFTKRCTFQRTMIHYLKCFSKFFSLICVYVCVYLEVIYYLRIPPKNWLKIVFFPFLLFYLTNNGVSYGSAKIWRILWEIHVTVVHSLAKKKNPKPPLWLY